MPVTLGDVGGGQRHGTDLSLCSIMAPWVALRNSGGGRCLAKGGEGAKVRAVRHCGNKGGRGLPSSLRPPFQRKLGNLSRRHASLCVAAAAQSEKDEAAAASEGDVYLVDTKRLGEGVKKHTVLIFVTDESG